ncbi:MAG TPA: hypothetical protein VGK19_24910 [Capsulimonadaceae bacterium]
MAVKIANVQTITICAIIGATLASSLLALASDAPKDAAPVVPAATRMLKVGDEWAFEIVYRRLVYHSANNDDRSQLGQIFHANNSESTKQTLTIKVVPDPGTLDGKATGLDSMGVQEEGEQVDADMQAAANAKVMAFIVTLSYNKDHRDHKKIAVYRFKQIPNGGLAMERTDVASQGGVLLPPSWSEGVQWRYFFPIDPAYQRGTGFPNVGGRAHLGTVSGADRATCKAGTFAAWKTQVSELPEDADLDTKSDDWWFAPEIGFPVKANVTFDENDTWTLNLVKFKPATDEVPVVATVPALLAPSAPAVSDPDTRQK